MVERSIRWFGTGSPMPEPTEVRSARFWPVTMKTLPPSYRPSLRCAAGGLHGDCKRPKGHKGSHIDLVHHDEWELTAALRALGVR